MSKDNGICVIAGKEHEKASKLLKEGGMMVEKNGVADMEGYVREMIDSGRNPYKFSDDDLSRLSEIIGILDSDSGDDVKAEVLREMYVKMCIGDKAKQNGIVGRYRDKRDAKEYRKMKSVLNGTVLAHAKKSVAQRFSQKIDKHVSLFGGGRTALFTSDKVARTFDEIEADIKTERSNVSELLSLYEKLKNAKKDDIEDIKDSIKTIECSDNRYVMIGAVINDSGTMPIDADEALNNEDMMERKIMALKAAHETYSAMLSFWPMLCRMSCFDIAVMEGVTIDGSFKIRSGIEEMEAIAGGEIVEDPENMTEELFRTDSEFRAAWKSTPNEVRSWLARMPKINGDTMQYEYNEIGEVITIGPMPAFQRLVTKLHDCSDSKDMIEMIKVLSTQDTMFENLYDILKDDDGKIGDLYKAVKRGLQLYSQFYVERRKGYPRWHSSIINGLLNRTKSSSMAIKNGKAISYAARMSSLVYADGDKYIGGKFSKIAKTEQELDEAIGGRQIYIKGGKRIENEEERKIVTNALNEKIYRWFVPVQESDDTVKVNGKDINRRRAKGFIEINPIEAASVIEGDRFDADDMMNWQFLRVNALIETACAVGIDMTVNMAINLVAPGNEGMLANYVNHFRKLIYGSPTSGFNVNELKRTADGFVLYDKDKNHISKFSKGEGPRRLNGYYDNPLYDYLDNSDGEMRQTLKKIDGIRFYVNEGMEYSLRATAKWRGNGTRTYESAIEPSFLTDFISNIRRLSFKEDRKGLVAYLNKMWLRDSKFMNSGEFIYNPILRELRYDAEYRWKWRDSYDQSPMLTSIINFERDLGTSDKDFSSMGEVEHELQRITMFFSGETLPINSDVARGVIYMRGEKYADFINKYCLGTEQIPVEYDNCRIIGEGYFELREGQYVSVLSTGTNIESDPGHVPQQVLEIRDLVPSLETNLKVPTAKYQMFVQGDSGASRYMVLPRYSVETVEDEMFNVYLSEISRMRQAKEMSESGIHIMNFNTSKKGKDVNFDRFTTLTFLNDYIDSKVNNIGMSREEAINSLSEEKVRELISENLNDTFIEWMAGIAQKGLLDIEKTTKINKREVTIERYKYMQQFIENHIIREKEYGYGDEVDIAYDNASELTKEEVQRVLAERLREYYYNDKLMQISMCQIFDVDPSMFSGVEEHQKREKQVCANGYSLDMTAEYVLSDGTIDKSVGMTDKYERSVYVKDIDTNCEEEDPKWMAGIVYRNCDEDKKGEVRELIEKRLTTHITAEMLRSMNDDTLKDIPWNVDSVTSEKIGKMSDEEVEKLANRMNDKRHSIIKGYFGDRNYDVLYASYIKNTLTDGQCWRCLTSARSIMIRMGRSSWTPKHEKAYRRIMSLRKMCKEEGRELTTSEVQEIEGLKVYFQPMKPISYGFEEIEYDSTSEDGETVKKTGMIGVQLKCSDTILIPELLEKGSKLRAMAEAMEQSFEEADNDPTGQTKKIDCIYSTECVKVGIHGAINMDGTADELYDMIRNFRDSKDSLHSIGWEYHRIQQNVPQHVSEERATGTQARKIVMSDLNFDSNADYSHYFAEDKCKGIFRSDESKGICIGYDDNGNPMYSTGRLTASELSQLYQQQFVANMLESMNEFERRLRDEEHISEEVISVMQNNLGANMDVVYGIMLEEKAEGPSETEEDEERKEKRMKQMLMPLIDSSVERDAVSAMLSIFRDVVNKHKSLGGSAVQQSPFGLIAKSREYTSDSGLKCSYDEEYNCVEVECELSWNQTYKDQYGRTHKIDFYQYNERDEKTGRWELKKNEDGVPLIETDFPGMLDIIAYRIPTERCYSMINLKVVRFTPMTSGGTIKVPSQFTTVAGFDFDIDKLYMLRRSFEENKSEWERLDLTKEQRSQIIEKIKELHPEYLIEIPEITENTFSEDQLYDIFGVIYGYNDEIKIDEVDMPIPVRPILEAARRSYTNREHNHLNEYWNKAIGISTSVKHAEKTSEGYRNYLSEKGIESSTQAYKDYLFFVAVQKLGYISNDLIVKKKGYTILSKEAIAVDGTTLGRLFAEAAKELGIPLSEEKREKRWKEYDLSKPPLEQESADVRNNMIFHIMRQRLADPETFVSRMTHGGFETAKDVSYMAKYLGIVAPRTLEEATDDTYEEAKKARPDDIPLDFSDPSTAVFFNKMQQVAAKMIGIMANQSTNNIFAQLLTTMQLKKEYQINLYGKGDNSTDDEGLGKNLVHRGNRKMRMWVDKAMAECLAAAVDAAKNPVLDYCGINMITCNASVLMLRTGYTFEDVALFMKQPIIEELCSVMTKNGCGVEKAVGIIKEKYFGGKDAELKVKNYLSKEENAKNILSYNINKQKDRKSFVENFKNGVENGGNLWDDTLKKNTDSMFLNGSFKAYQESVLAMFLNMNDSAKELTDWIMKTKMTATGSIGTTVGQIYSELSKAEKQKELKHFIVSFNTPYGSSMDDGDSTIMFGEETDHGDNISSLISSYDKSDEERLNGWKKYITYASKTPFSSEQSMYNMLKFSLKNIFGKVLPFETERYQNVLGLVSQMSIGGTPNPDVIDKIFGDIPLWTMCTSNGFFNFDRPYYGIADEGEVDIITYASYLLTVFPNQFIGFMNKYEDRNRGMMLFNDAIDTDIEDMEDSAGRLKTVTRLFLTSMARNPDYKDQLQNEVLDIIAGYKHSDDQYYKDAMKMICDLYAYGVLVRGFDYTNLNFNEIIPVDFKRAIEVGGSSENPVYYDEKLRMLTEDRHDDDLHTNNMSYLIAYVVKHINDYDVRRMIKFVNEDKSKKQDVYLSGQLRESDTIIISGNKLMDIALSANDKEVVLPPVIVSGNRYNYNKDALTAVYILDPSSVSNNEDGFVISKNVNPKYKYIGSYKDISSNTCYYSGYNVVGFASKNENSSVGFIGLIDENDSNNSEIGTIVSHEIVDNIDFDSNKKISETAKEILQQDAKLINEAVKNLRNNGEEVEGAKVTSESPHEDPTILRFLDTENRIPDSEGRFLCK